MDLDNFKADNIVFGEPKLCKFSGGTYYRIPIQYNENGKPGELCIATAQLMSFGIQEVRGDRDTKDGPVEGYSLSLIVDDDKTYRVIEEITQKCRDHLKLNEVKKALKKWELVPDAMTPFYRKRDEYGNFEDSPPKIYPRLFTKFQTNPLVIASSFYDSNDDSKPIDPTDLINVRCKLVAALIFRDIYIGAKPSIQIKVSDAIVYDRLASCTRRRLLFDKFKTVEPVIEQQQQQDPTTALNKLIRRIN